MLIRGRTPQDLIEEIVQWIRSYVRSAGAKGVILGMSGGVDSALCAFLIQKAFPEHSLGLLLPCHSSQQDIRDALEVCRASGLRSMTIDIGKQHDALLRQVLEAAEGSKEESQGHRERMVDANLRARLRMSMLYAVAGMYGYLVIGTDNAAELYTGYFTKYGDGGADLLPLAPLLKREVFALAKYVGVPQSVLDKKPSAGLWDGQTDEEELGTTYEMIDDFLLGRKISSEQEQKIQQLHKTTEHKRKLPPQWRTQWVE